VSGAIERFPVGSRVVWIEHGGLRGTVRQRPKPLAPATAGLIGRIEQTMLRWVQIDGSSHCINLGLRQLRDLDMIERISELA